MFCKDCKEDAVASLLEQKLSLCLPCIEKRASEFEGLKEACITLDGQVKKDRELIDVTEKKLEKISHLMQAELAGQTSAQNGLGEDQNPFSMTDEEGSKSHVMWLAGWTAIDTRRKALQAHAVMTWAGGVLIAVNELAKGYGQQEIAAKLDVVISKFGQYVQPE